MASGMGQVCPPLEVTMTVRRSRCAAGAAAALLAACLATVADAGQRDAPRRPEPGRDPGRAMGTIGITLFSETGFGGTNANFRDDVPDLRKFRLNDQAISLRVGRDEVWEVCEDKDYKGRCQVFSGDEADLGRVSWNARISSVRRLPDDARSDRRPGRDRGRPSGPGREEARLELFNDPGFRGNSVILTDAAPDLRARSNRSGSVRVYGGEWELCDDERFRGHCATISDDVPDLKRVGLRDKVSSVRPLRRNR